MKNFISPHVHVSSFDSASTPESFLQREKELDTKSMVITDHGSLSGCLQVYNLAKSNGLIPILGMEGYLRDDNCPILTQRGVDKKDGSFKHHFKYGHFTVHFQDQEAYLTAVRLLSHAKNESHGSESKPIFDWNMLEELCAKNVTVSSGCLIGFVQRHLIAHDDVETAVAYYEKVRGMVKPGNFYVEVFPHTCDKYWQSGIFLQFNEGDKITKLKLYDQKTLMTNVGEIQAARLVEEFNRKTNKHLILKGIKNNRKWEEYPDVKILEIKRIEEFIQSECRPWAPNGDLQQGTNSFMIRMAKKYGDPVLISDDCVVKDTLIRTKDRGYVPVQDINPGDEVLTHLGRYRTVEATKGTLSSKPLVSIFGASSKLVTVTEEHRVLVKNAKKVGYVSQEELEKIEPIWVEARHIQPQKMYVLCPNVQESNWIVVTQIEVTVPKQPQPVFDLQVKDDCSFVAGTIAVHNCHFAYPKSKAVQDVRLMASGGGNFRFASVHSRMSSKEAWEHFERKQGTSLKEFESWVENSYEFQSKFKGFEYKREVSLPSKFFPADTLQHTKELIRKHGRMDWKNPAMVERLSQELKVLHENGHADLLPYFFVFEEACQKYTDAGELVGAGRGSGGGVLLNYLLGITHMDPLKWGLSFERFITLDRITSGSWPDIDQDLPSTDLMLNWAKERFGDHFCQISTVTTLKLRSAIKDVARVQMGRVPEEIEKLAARIEVAPQGVTDHAFVFGYEDSGEWKQGTIDTDKALQEYIQKYPDQWEIVKDSLGLGRQLGRHASGYVIANKPISEFIPTIKISDQICTAYPPPSVEMAGGIKFDFLTVNILNDLSTAIALIRKRSGRIPSESDKRKAPLTRLVPDPNGEGWYDIWNLPEEQAVFKDIVTGNTETVFQFNTPGAIKQLKHFNFVDKNGNLGIDSIKKMAIFTALDRPGPLDAFVSNPENPGQKHNILVEYVRRLEGKLRSPDLAPLDGLVPETEDLLVFQESVQNIYKHFTGCTLSEAEKFRRDIGKKKKESIAKLHQSWMERVSPKIGEEKAKKIWDTLNTFSGYGFNASHAVSYAITGYACAWLKHHYPLEWWTAVLTNSNKEEISNKFWKHVSHLVRLPDISKSTETFTIVDGKIQAPTTLLYGLGEKAHQQLMAGRPYTDIADFVNKIKKFQEENSTTKETVDSKTGEIKIKKKLGTSALKRNVVYNLIVSGTLDSLYPPDTNVLDKLQIYEDLIGNGKVDERYVNVTPIQRYQIVKDVLPVYTSDLLPLLNGVDGVIKRPDGKAVYRTKHGEYPFVTIEQILQVEQIRPFADELKVALPAYVMSTKTWSFSRGTAKKFFLEANGEVKEFIKWPNKHGELLEKFKKIDDESIGIFILSKWKEKDFVVEDAIVLAEPFKKRITDE